MADELQAWLPECAVDAEPAVCELNPCGHFISLTTARDYARLIRTQPRHPANPNNCPMCRKKWNNIRCLSVEKSVEKIRAQLEAYTRDIPEGPLRVWFQQILHFFISRNNFVPGFAPFLLRKIFCILVMYRYIREYFS